MPLDCEAVGALLPWLANRTLAGSEEAEVRAHLGRCDRCRGAYDETLGAWELYGRHVPVEMLLDYEQGLVSDRKRRTLLKTHLEGCPSCREELHLLRESRRSLEAEPSSGRAVAPAWRVGGIAASLVSAIALGGWLVTARRADSLSESIAKSADLERRLDVAISENSGLKEAQRQLESRLGAMERDLAAGARAILNVPIFELLPASVLTRGEETPNAVEVPHDAAWVSLVLAAPKGESCARCELELLDESGRVRFSASGLVRQDAGDYTLGLPSDVLGEGKMTLRLYDRSGSLRRTIESYPVRIRRSGG
jgi:hypothetical protein